ncbi:lymphocyte antigen 6 complex locus protein G6d-like [Orbicella faveolata]|uniref:lymphocyte antigen 6 complex locus protein G6d-like n=1 Tax=Orbicella faveolata TaxID=48498 RepID=UPI0009E397C3|nr:lymphocyte antigen 6 complex locus protein G6d-like [Orbicella faveolata]
MKSVFVLAFLLCISVGYGLKCYQCITLKDWDDCDKTEVTCARGADRCAKALVTGKQGEASVSVYAKGCSLSSTCNADKSELCKSSDPKVSVTECEINCCSGDLCNGAKVPMVSVFMLLACVLAAFLR